MGYPTNNVKRRNRRRLQSGQGPFPAPITTIVTGSGSVVTLTFSQPVNVSGTIPITVASLNFVSQSIVSPTVVNITMSGAVATHAWTFPSNPATVSSYHGGAILGGSGSF